LNYVKNKNRNKFWL